MYCNSTFKTILGDDYSKVKYGNLMTEGIKSLEFYLKNLKTSQITQVTGYENKWHNNSHLPIYAVNGISTTFCDFIGGEKNKDSYNFLVDLEFSEPINKAVFIASGGKSFFPTKLNVYLADSKEEIFSKDKKPIVIFDKKNEYGTYIAEFEPTRARFVRFEVVDTENNYYNGKLITVVKEISVYGALDAKQPTFGLELYKKMKTSEQAAESLMKPYLYKNSNGSIITVNRSVDDEILKEISHKKIGDSYSKVNLNSRSFINIGNTDVTTEISTSENLPELTDYSKIYFYIKAEDTESFGSGKFKLQIVNSVHKAYFVPIILEANKWTRIDLGGIFDITKYGQLRRIAIFVDDGNINTSVTVGSLQGIKAVDSNVWKTNIDSVSSMPPEMVSDDFKKQLEQYNIFI